MPSYERSVLVARDIMTTSVVGVRPDMGIHEAIDILVGRDISGAPVVERDGSLVGVLSGKDCLRVLAHESWYDALGGVVADFMTTEVDTITPDTDIFRIADRFLHKPYRRLPVCDGPSLVGIVSRGDVLRGIQRMQRQRQRQHQQYPDYKRPDAPEKVTRSPKPEKP